MKYTTIIVILLSLSDLVHAEGDGKTIQVDKTKFSKIYPAVWFSPSTGEIAPLKKLSDIPPEKKYEIWIEPRDPEFGYNPDQEPVGVGFVLIGKGAEAFKNPKIPKDLKLELKITDLVKESKAYEQPVFYCKGKTSTCLIMLTSLNSKDGVVVFKWRVLGKDQKEVAEAKAAPNGTKENPQAKKMVEDEELRKTPKDICIHVLELMQKDDLKGCLRYVKDSEREAFKSHYKKLRYKLSKKKILYSREHRKSATEHEVYFHFGGKEDDFDLELIDGAWKIVTL